MPDYRTMYDESEYVAAADLKGRDVTLTIASCVGGVIVGERGRKTKKPVVHFKEAKKGLALNKTNGKTIARLYGPEVAGWAGKRITLFPTQTDSKDGVVDCIRVRPEVPRSAPSKALVEQPVIANAPSEKPSCPPDPPSDLEVGP